jgi:protein disulfide-isomerase A1
MRVLLALAVLAAVCVAEFPEEDDVLVLTEDNFDDALKQFDLILVEFYAPWCGHCKKLAPEFSKAAKTLKADPAIPLGKVDATENKQLAERFGVRGYPTLKFFKNGKATEYGGGRTDKEIVSWLRKKSGPAAKTVTSVEEIKDLKEANEVVVVGYLADEAEAFLGAANELDDIVFAVAKDAALKEAMEASADVMLYKKFDEGVVAYEGDMTAPAIAEFVRSNSLPLVNAFTKDSARSIFAGAIKKHMLYFGSAEAIAEFTPEYKTVAADYKGDFLFVTVEPTADNDRIIDYFGASTSPPSAILVDMDGGGGQLKKFKLEGEVTTAGLRELLEEFKAGAISPWLKSDEIPETQDEAVWVVVGKSFEDVVLNQEKDVLLEFYAPWCGHCKQLAPKFEELAQKLAHVDTLVIAKMDATANEVNHPDVNVRGFPTIKFFPAGSDRVLDYEGAREVDDFVEWLQENVHHKFTLEGVEMEEAEVEAEGAKDEL